MKKSQQKLISVNVKDHLVISGDAVFYSIQGEGASIGKPSCFLRLHNCNLKCSWCDTKYTWDKTSKEYWTESQVWSINKTVSIIKKTWGCNNPKITKRLIITGGEPLLQNKNIELLIDKLKDWKIEIETNGTIEPSAGLLKRCQFNCSPKLKNSNNPKKIRIKEKSINKLKQANTNFKFIVNSKNDLVEIEKDFIDPFKIDPNTVIIMPEGIDPSSLSKTTRKIVFDVLDRGYRLGNRFHVEIWGNKRAI